MSKKQISCLALSQEWMNSIKIVVIQGLWGGGGGVHGKHFQKKEKVDIFYCTKINMYLKTFDHNILLIGRPVCFNTNIKPFSSPLFWWFLVKQWRWQWRGKLSAEAWRRTLHFAAGWLHCLRSMHSRAELNQATCHTNYQSAWWFTQDYQTCYAR